MTALVQPPPAALGMGQELLTLSHMKITPGGEAGAHAPIQGHPRPGSSRLPLLRSPGQEGPVGTARTVPKSSLAPHSLDPALAALAAELAECSEVKREVIPEALEQSSSGRTF